MNLEQRIIKELNRRKHTIGELAGMFRVNKRKVRDILFELKRQHFSIVSEGSGKDKVYWIDDTRATVRTYLISNRKDRKTTIWYGSISDLHIGSELFRGDLFLDYMKRAYNDYGVNRFLVAGDIVDGIDVYKGQHNFLKAYTQQDQVDMVCEIFPDWKGLEYYIIDGNHDYCISFDTEVFTKEGWKTIETISESDFVLTLNPKGLKPEFKKIKQIVKFDNPSSGIFEINGRGISLVCTGKHRLTYLPYNKDKKKGERIEKKLKFREVMDYMKSKNSEMIIPTSTILGNNDFNIKDDMLRLIAWILTDGQIKKRKKDVTFVIYQSKKEMAKRIRKILNNLNIKFKETKRDRRNRELIIKGKKVKKQLVSHIFKFDSRELNKFIKDKSVQDWMYKLSKRQFDLFLSELIRGDGSNYKGRECYILYGKEWFLEEIQTLCHLFGYRATVTKSNRNDFRLNICKRTIATITQKNIIRKRKNEPVWCIIVENGNFMARYNGKISFTGNSWTKKGAPLTGKLISLQRKDIHYLGYMVGDVMIDGLRIRMLHGAGGGSYAVSYPVQRYLRNVMQASRETLPDIIHLGHYHTRVDGMQVEGVTATMNGHFQEPNEWYMRRGFVGPMGGHIVDVEVRNGKKLGFNARWIGE
jgi:hypothetical protein